MSEDRPIAAISGFTYAAAFNRAARVISVIETTLLRRGDGTQEKPIRVIRQYWSLDGELLAEVDPIPAPEKRL